MINHPLMRGLSTRRLILLATVANLGIAGIVIGSSPQSIVPIFSAAAAEDAQRPVGFADLVEKVKPAVSASLANLDQGTFHRRPRA
jgi:serine protease Do